MPRKSSRPKAINYLGPPANHWWTVETKSQSGIYVWQKVYLVIPQRGLPALRYLCAVYDSSESAFNQAPVMISQHMTLAEVFRAKHSEEIQTANMDNDEVTHKIHGLLLHPHTKRILTNYVAEHLLTDPKIKGYIEAEAGQTINRPPESQEKSSSSDMGSETPPARPAPEEGDSQGDGSPLSFNF